MSKDQVQITFHGLQRSEALEALIYEKADKLHSMDVGLRRTRVVVDLPHRSHQKGNHLEIKVELHRHGEDPLVIRRDSELDAEHDSAFNLVREVFGAAQRVVGEHAHRKETDRRPRG